MILQVSSAMPRFMEAMINEAWAPVRKSRRCLMAGKRAERSSVLRALNMITRMHASFGCVS